MSKKYFRLLLGLVALLLAAFLLFDSEERSSVKKDSRLLLTEFNSDQITSVGIERGKDKVELKQVDGAWVVGERYGYRADLNKLRSLLLKLLDVSVSQRVRTDEKNYEKLGVTDEAYKTAEPGSSIGKVTLSDQSSKVLAAVLLGEKRKKGTGAEAALGQFVRRQGEKEVFMLSEPIELTVTPALLIDTELLSLSSQNVRRVLQQKIDGEKKEKLFELQSIAQTDGTNRFELDLEPTAKQEIQKPVVDSISGGLENVRVQDVLDTAAANESLKGKNFDLLTRYELANGEIYEVESLIDGKRGFARIKVSFDQALVDRTQRDIASQNEKKKAEIEVLKKSAIDKKEKPPAEFVPTVAQVVTEDEAKKENKKFEGWVFEFPTFQIEKYRRLPEDLIKGKAEPAAPSGVVN